MELVILFVCAILVAAAIVYLISFFTVLAHDPCPRVYEGLDCKQTTNWPCDHSDRAWALKGIDKEYIYGQPIKGTWNDPNREE